MTLILTDGREVDDQKVQFDPQAQRFYLPDYIAGTVEDISDLLTQHDRIVIAGPAYDVNAELIRHSENNPGGSKAPPESESTTMGVLTKQAGDAAREVDDLMSGVADAAGNLASGAKNALNAAPKILNPLAVIAVVLGLVYFARKI